MKKLTIFLGTLVCALGLIALVSGQIPSILPISPVTESIVFQKDVTIEGTLTASGTFTGTFNTNSGLATGEVGLNLYSITPTFATLAQSDAEGIATSSDTRLGLDETLRNFILCDRGDIGDDFTLAASTHPSLVIFNAGGTGSDYSVVDYNSFYASGAFQLSGDYLNFQVTTDLDAGNFFTFDSSANIELADADAEQAWVYLEPKINQTGTATAIDYLVNSTETSLGSGGHLLFDFRISDASKISARADDADLAGAAMDMGGVMFDVINESMADNAKIDLPGSDSGGMGMIVAGDNTAYVYFVFTSAGVVTLVSQNNCTTTEDNDTTFNIFDSGDDVGLNNELGATVTVKGWIMYIPD